MIRKEFLWEELQALKSYMIPFLKHPLKEIRNVPDWHWNRILLLLVAVSSATGALTGLIEKKIFSIIVNIIFNPIVSMSVLTVSTLFFYYCFQIFYNQTVPPRRLFTVVLLANIPQLIFQIASGYVPPIALVGMAFTAFLLLVGFVDNFKIDRKIATRIVLSLYALFFAVWLFSKRDSMRFDRQWAPDSMTAPEVRLGE